MNTTVHTREHASILEITPEENTCPPCRSSLSDRNSDSAESPKSPSPHCSHVLPARLFSQPTSTTQTSNIPAGIPQQQDMLNNNKTISVTSMLLSLTRFSGSSQMTVYYSQFTKSKALNGSLPWSWIKAPKPYARLDHGDPPSSFRTKETDYNVSSWTDANQFLLLRRTPGLTQDPQ